MLALDRLARRLLVFLLTLPLLRQRTPILQLLLLLNIAGWALGSRTLPSAESPDEPTLSASSAEQPPFEVSGLAV